MNTVTARKASTRKKSRAARPTIGKQDEDGRNLIGQIALLRMRVAAAEAIWKEAKEQANQAKRRRKLAKLLAKRAKKDARNARARMDEAREALAQAQARCRTLGLAASRKNIRKTKSTGTALKKRRSTRHVTEKSSRPVKTSEAQETSVVPPPAENVPATVVETAVTPSAPGPEEVLATS